MAKYIRNYAQDLRQKVWPRFEDNALFTDDNEAVEISVAVLDGGAPATLSGDVVGFARRANGTKVPLDGTRSGNVCSIVLEQACNAYPGDLGVVIKLVDGETVTTLLKVIYPVIDTSSGQTVDPGHLVPDITQLLAMLNEMDEATDAANAAAAAVPSIIAPTFSESAAYMAGSYVYYNGALYRFTADHAAGTWTGSDAVSVQLAPEVSELKSAILEEKSVGKTASRASDIFINYGSNGYINISNGVFVSDSNYHCFLYTFANDTDISISNSGNGLVGAILYSETLETLPTSSSGASSYFVKGARSDKTGSEALPSPESAWTCNAGQMLVIYTQDGNKTTDFLLSYNVVQLLLGDSLLLNTAQEAQVLEIIPRPKKPIIKYGSVDTDIGAVGKEQVTFYLPTDYGYVKYAFVRCESDARNANNWRIDKCYACDDLKNVLFPITNSGEWEMAIKIAGRSDFMGGIAHGDEVISAIHFLVDGNEIDSISSLTEREFERVIIVETTSLYDPADGATLSTKDSFSSVGTHGREYVITKDGIRLIQCFVPTVSMTLAESYMTMLPIIRGNDGASERQITDRYFADNNYTEQDVAVAGNTSAFGWKRNVTRATIWGQSSGVCASVEMVKQPSIDNTGARLFQVSNSASYNKLYWSICGCLNADYDASANERFITESLYKISCKDV